MQSQSQAVGYCNPISRGEAVADGAAVVVERKRVNGAWLTPCPRCGRWKSEKAAHYKRWAIALRQGAVAR